MRKQGIVSVGIVQGMGGNANNNPHHHSQEGHGDSVTQLFRAAKDGNLEQIKPAMKKLGSNDHQLASAMGAKDEYGRTALMYAAQGGHKRIVKTLLKAGSDARHKDVVGNTALNLACFYGRKEVAKTLLHSKYTSDSDLFRENSHGETVLMQAASYGRDEIVKLLLRAVGQSEDDEQEKVKRKLEYVEYANSEGVSAYGLARAHGHSRVLDVLEAEVEKYDDEVIELESSDEADHEDDDP